MPPVVIHHVEFAIPHLTAPLDGLSDAAGGGYLAVGGVCVGGCDVAGGAEYLAHVLGEVKSVGVPGAVFLDGQGTGGDGLGGVPGDEPKTRVVATGEVDAGNLQIPTVQVTLVERNAHRA